MQFELRNLMVLFILLCDAYNVLQTAFEYMQYTEEY